ncbi:MAG: TetR/AcrR family transcriptional regulator [Rhizobiaceae bacterium]|nr:TetR/AcrR family transcriptional regulator [Rhizobiaceae bacterium]
MQEGKGMRRSNPERTDATRTALLHAARRLFVEKGYGGTSTPEIVAAAGVTRGALYHHFADKKAVFAAVFEREAAAVAEAIEAAAPAAMSALDALIEGSRAYLEAMAAPGRCRILLVEGPAALGAEEAGRIDRDNAERTLREGLAAAMAAGAFPSLPLGPLATQLSALLDRAALSIEQGEPLAEHMAVVGALLRGLAHSAQAA